MSIQTNREERIDSYNALMNCRQEAEALQEEIDNIAFSLDEKRAELEALEIRIREFEDELGLD